METNNLINEHFGMLQNIADIAEKKGIPNPEFGYYSEEERNMARVAITVIAELYSENKELKKRLKEIEK